MNYIVSTPMVPKNVYELGNGYVIQAVQPFESMFDCEIIPHGYEAVLALTFADEKPLPERYNVYRNLAVFHSFMSDDEEAFEQSASRGIINTYSDSELSYLTDPEGGLDFERFPLRIPKLSDSEDIILHNYEEVAGLECPYPYENEIRQVRYKDLFQKFCEFENSINEAERHLHGQVYSCVFMRSLWDVTHIELLYKNYNLSAMVYMAILENIIGEPSLCGHQKGEKCPVCTRWLRQHYNKEWVDHFRDGLNALEPGWGDQYARTIMFTRNEMRNPFAHGAAYADVSQGLWKIYDKRDYYGKDVTEEDRSEERRLLDVENSVGILERTVRKALTARFLNVCGC
jgi:hypothetical protein